VWKSSLITSWKTSKSTWKSNRRPEVNR
jgi:hypothetical protein